MPLKQRLRASALCLAEGHLLVVRLRDPGTGVEALYPPGGAIEAGELPEEAARRETLEETGLAVRIDPAVGLVDTYPFTWGDEDRLVTTHYFAAALESPFERVVPLVKDAEYNLGASWVPVAKALTALAVNPAIGAACARVVRLAEVAAWQKHPSFAGPASTLLAIHGQFRAASERLSLLIDREAESDLAGVARAFQPLAQTLRHHHHAEEEMLFPLIEAQTGLAPERLVSDHEELTAAIEAVQRSLGTGVTKEGARAAVARFHEVLLAHLDREEEIVIPVLLTLLPEEAWARIHGGQA